MWKMEMQSQFSETVFTENEIAIWIAANPKKVAEWVFDLSKKQIDFALECVHCDVDTERSKVVTAQARSMVCGWLIEDFIRLVETEKEIQNGR